MRHKMSSAKQIGTPLVLAMGILATAMITTSTAPTANPATPPPSQPEKKPAASAGLLNDWLREQSSGFKA